MVAIVDAQPGALVVQRQGFRDAIRQLVATLRRQDRRGERPAALDLGLGQVAAADLMRQALQGEQLAAVEGEVGEILRQLARAAQFRRRLDLAALGEQYAAALAAPGTVVAVGHQQAAALALGSQPEALALGVDGDPFEERVEIHQHAAGPRLRQQAGRQAQPVRRAAHRQLQDRRVRLADQVAIAGGIAGDAFEVEVAAAHQATEPDPRAHAPGQPAVRRGRSDETLGLGLPGLVGAFGRGLQAIQAVVVAVGNRPQRAATPGQPREVAAAHALHRMFRDEAQGCRNRWLWRRLGRLDQAPNRPRMASRRRIRPAPRPGCPCFPARTCGHRRASWPAACP